MNCGLFSPIVGRIDALINNEDASTSPSSLASSGQRKRKKTNPLMIEKAISVDSGDKRANKIRIASFIRSGMTTNISSILRIIAFQNVFKLLLSILKSGAMRSFAHLSAKYLGKY